MITFIKTTGMSWR